MVIFERSFTDVLLIQIPNPAFSISDISFCPFQPHCHLCDLGSSWGIFITVTYLCVPLPLHFELTANATWGTRNRKYLTCCWQSWAWSMWLRSKVGISLPSSLPSKSVSGDLLESKSQLLSWSGRGEDSVLLISSACFFPYPNRGRGRTCPGWPEHQRAHSHYADPETEPQMGCPPLPTSFPVPRIRSRAPSLAGNGNREG